MEETRTINPVFLMRKNMPDDTDRPFSVREICSAAEKSSGYNSVLGAQRIGGLWRVYPKSKDARTQLLLKGIETRGHLLQPFDKNPYIVRTPDGEQEVKTTKVVIGNLPLSYSNDDIEKKLSQLGCQLHSKLMMEKDRDDNGGLTRWLTGRRFVYIKVPDQPLPDKIQIGTASASLFHREQRLKAECSRCFKTGHTAKTCENDIICRTCKKPGHKTGHPSCDLASDDKNTDEGSQQNATTPAQPLSTPAPASPSSPAGPRPSRRGRPAKQAVLSFSATRSLSREKRRRSPVTRQQSESEGKAARRDDSRDRDVPEPEARDEDSECTERSAT